MAKFILGSVITNIAGSVGGTTFRRVPNGFSMFNKIKGTSKSRLLQNSRIPQIGAIFQQWSLLDSSMRDAWTATAGTVTFPDKFGTPKNLTGRELFSKANIQSLPTGFPVTNPTGFTTVTESFVLDSFDFSLTEEQFPVTFSGITATAVVMLSAEVVNKKILQPTFKSRKVFIVLDVDVDGSFDVKAEFLAQFPYFQNGMSVALYAQAINTYGMISPYQFSIQSPA